MKTERCRTPSDRTYSSRQVRKKIGTLLLATSILSVPGAIQAVDVISYTGTNYTQDFNSLPFTSGSSINAADPITLGNAAGSPSTATKFTLNGSANATFSFASPIDTSGTTAGSTGGLGLSSTMPGWYGGASVGLKLGASAGDQTTGGIISFGAVTGSNRALGLSATSTSGLTTVGMELVNNTGATLNQIDLQFTEELWRQQTTQQVMNLGYQVVASPTAAMPLTGTSSLGAGSFSFPTGTSSGSTVQTAPITTTSYNSTGTSTLIGNWAPGTALWITFQTSQAGGGSQELALDNLSFSASLGASTPTWNTTSGTWTVGTGTNWTGGTGTVFLNGDNVTFNNSAGGTVTADAGGVLPGTTTVSAISGTYTFTGGSIGGTGALAKSGNGTLVLSSPNSYSGGTVINGGILSTGSDANLGATSGGITFGGGTLQTSAGITSARSVTVNSSGGTFDTNGFDSALSGNITGGGTLTKAGSGALTLSGTNTYGGTNLNAGTVNNNGSLTVSGGGVAFNVAGSSTLSNNGSITQTGTGRVIRDNTGGLTFTVNNGSSTNSTAVMQAADADVIQMNKPDSNVTLNNYGTMTSLNASKGGSQAVDFNAITTGSNTINNFSTGIMQASEADAVRPGVNGFVNNDGLIKATTTTGSSSDGVDAQTNTGITIVNAASAGSGTGTGTIEGARHGITGGNVATDSNGNATVNNGAYTMSITNNKGGTIQGDNGSGVNIDGLNANEVVTVVNHGTITGNGHDIGDGSAHDGDGLDIDGVVNITNTGLVKSINAYGGAPANGVQPIESSEGVTVGGGTIVNSGTIQGSVAAGNTTAIGRGITIAGVDKLLTTAANGTVTETAIPAQAPYAPTTITNQTGGKIIGDSDSGIIFSSGLSSGFSHSITNQPGALIQTGSTTAPAILTAADPVTINNSGTIDGSSSGKAITGGSGSLTLNVTGGTASILGDVAGGTGGINVATVDPGTGNTFSYAGSISNFSQVEVKSGILALTGTSTYSGTTKLSGGQLLLQAANLLSSASPLDLNGGNLKISNIGAANGQTFATLTLEDNSGIDLNNTSSLTFDGFTSFTLGKGLTIADYDPSDSPNYAIRFEGDFTSNANFLAMLAATTVDGSAPLVSYDGAFTNVGLAVAAVPEPTTFGFGVALVGMIGWRRRRKIACA